MALVSFLLLISGLKKSKKMVKYNTHKGLNNRLPNFQVRLGLGLHLGYAIEGAIGSYYKIDASYLSPHVRMSERLEALTKHYVVPVLLTGNLYRYFTEETQNECRQVDFVQMSGMEEPVSLFTVDVASEKIMVEDDVQVQTGKQSKIRRVQERLKRNKMKEDAFNNKINISDNFYNNLELQIMRSHYTQEFYDTYNEGFNFYLEGQWHRALPVLKKVLEIEPGDRPT